MGHVPWCMYVLYKALHVHRVTYCSDTSPMPPLVWSLCFGSNLCHGYHTNICSCWGLNIFCDCHSDHHLHEHASSSPRLLQAQHTYNPPCKHSRGSNCRHDFSYTQPNNAICKHHGHHTSNCLRFVLLDDPRAVPDHKQGTVRACTRGHTKTLNKEGTCSPTQFVYMWGNNH